MDAKLEEHAASVNSRYDEFQAEAVSNLLCDFSEKPNGRFLLVIPTGGGKTYTAVKAINGLFKSGVLDSKKDTVVWGAHRTELVKQAADTFMAFAETRPDEDYSSRVVVGMMSKVVSQVQGDSENIKIAVIDEAHHAIVNNVSYSALFEYPNLGLLGLTATPSRHDGQPLDFEKESYSIGFPDLVERQLILSPTIEEITGGRFVGIEAKGVVGMTGLDALDCQSRDEKIIAQLKKFSEKYQKVIIYAATKKHVRSLFARVRDSELSQKYQSIDYILGGNEYSGNDASREDFIERVKAYDRSIIINCDVLTEGYDDPTVNTVVMAAPTRSKLVYMQAIGRCIRVDKSNPLKRAYIVEVVDDLPNIRYRINNRWLFSEISDTLEPAVEDRFFSGAEEFKNTLLDLFRRYDVDSDAVKIPEWNKRTRYSLLLFRSYKGAGKYRHLPILIDGTNRPAVSSWFNYLSERMGSFQSKAINFEAAMKMARYQGIDGLVEPNNRQLIYEAMEEAQKALSNAPDTEAAPWITFVSLRYKAAAIPDELRSFLADVVNSEQIEERFINRSFRPGDYIVKLPLPLARSIAMLMTPADFEVLNQLINSLKSVCEDHGNIDHTSMADRILKQAILPIPMMYATATTQIVREDLEYFYKLD